MRNLEQSLIGRLIMLGAFLIINARTILDDEKNTTTYPLWMRVGLRLKTNIDKDELGLLAAGIAFYFLLAAFPALAAIVSLFALFADPMVIADQMSLLGQFLPADSLNILTDQVRKISTAQNSTLSISFIFSFLFTFYVASKGVRVLIKGFNVAYDYEENRNIFMRTVIAYGLTVGFIIYMLVALVVIAGIPVFFQITPFTDTLQHAYLWLRWPALYCAALAGLEFLYIFGPATPNRQWGWFSLGSVTATALWVGVSSLFSLFVTNFSNYNETYGSLSAVVVLLLWFWLSALMMLLGAEINAAFAKERTKFA